MALRFGSLFYQCNVCGSSCVTPASDMTREAADCTICGSTPRYRALVSALSRELFGKSIALPDFPVAKQIRGIGMTASDSSQQLVKTQTARSTALHAPGASPW